jgi:hypothetical protein
VAADALDYRMGALHLRLDIMDALLGTLEARVPSNISVSANFDLATSSSDGDRGVTSTSARFGRVIIHNGAIINS